MEKELREEIKFQNQNAPNYIIKRRTDFIWEIPEELFLIKRKYFKEKSVVIDMGCGPSISLKNILTDKTLKRCRYTGVDISKELLKYAKKNIPYGEFIYEDISSVRFNKNYADIILSLGALHHTENKLTTLNSWIKILKKGGLLLIREPTFEALKRGQGESPTEEGIKVEEVLSFLHKNNIEVVSFIYFCTSVFHFFNKVMIKIKLNNLQKVRFIWYPVVLTDILLNKIFFNKSIFKGEAFVLVAKKL